MSLHKSVTNTILKKFSAEELESLSRFLHFSLGEKNEPLKKAYAYLQSAAPSFPPSLCNKEAFSKAVFGKKLNSKYDKEINRIMSEIKAEAEKYIVYRFAIHTPLAAFAARFNWYFNKNMLSGTDKVLKEMEEELLSGKATEIPELYKQYLDYKINRSQHNGDTALTYFMFGHQLNFLKNKDAIINIHTQTGFANVQRILGKNSIEEIKKKVRNDYLKLDFSNELAYHKAVYDFLKAPTLELYDYLKEKITDTTLLLEYMDRYNTSIILSNNIHVVSGTREAEPEKLYLAKVNLDLLRKNKGIVYFTAIDTYFNTLLSLQMTQEAKATLKKHKGIIIGIEDEDNYLTICQAKILNAEQKYAEALYLINQCHYENKHQQSSILRLKVVLAYEMKEVRLFEAYVNNLRKFFSTKGKKLFSEPTVKQYLAVVKYLARLLSESKQAALLSIKQEMLADVNLYDKKYLLEKVDEKFKDMALSRKRHKDQGPS
ncbi:MAG TPA: hypothetical protein VK154_12635 [Chitinophagales bacterium]|nr:hypothetical protein [Chitinophagales bacterium]